MSVGLLRCEEDSMSTQTDDSQSSDDKIVDYFGTQTFRFDVIKIVESPADFQFSCNSEKPSSLTKESDIDGFNHILLIK